jgi:hypothetical protein
LVLPDHRRLAAFQVHVARCLADSFVVSGQCHVVGAVRGGGVDRGGVGLLFRRSAVLAGLMTGSMIFSWFWIVHLPRMFTSVSDGIAVFEALGVFGDRACRRRCAFDGPSVGRSTNRELNAPPNSRKQKAATSAATNAATAVMTGHIASDRTMSGEGRYGATVNP